jgi:pentatricopeptide repeat protein
MKPTEGVASKMVAMAPSIMQLNIFSWNKKFTKYVKDGQPQRAMQLFQQVQREGINLDKFTFVQVIITCAGLGTFEDGKHVHE